MIEIKTLPGLRTNLKTEQGSAIMPYQANSALPASVRSHLPNHAQDIYREAFNNAFAAHAGEIDQEERAHRIAWAAVKHSYVKVGNDWVARKSQRA